MLMVMFVIAMLQMRYESQAKTLPDVPLNWGGENAYTYGHHALPQKTTEPAIKKPLLSLNSSGIYKSTNNVVVDMKPCLKVAQCDSSECKLNKTDESNLERWRTEAQLVNLEDLAPRQAVELSKGGSTRTFSARTRNHHPWHLAYLHLWPELETNRRVLHYELIKTPTLQNPNYEAIVCAMPNIRCKAKTLEALQEQLLHQYAVNLETLLQPSVSERKPWTAIMPFQSDLELPSSEQTKLSRLSQELNRQPWVQFCY